MDMAPSPFRVQPKMKRAESGRPMLRMDKDGPMVPASNENDGDPNLVTPKVERGEPKLAML